MTSTEKQLISNELKMGEEMNVTTFSELVKEMTGVSFKEIYKNNLNNGMDNHEQSNLE